MGVIASIVTCIVAQLIMNSNNIQSLDKTLRSLKAYARIKYQQLRSLFIYRQVVLFIFILIPLLSISQIQTTDQEITLPKVFVIGDFQENYEKLFSTYPDILITACNDNLDTAQAAWLSYVTTMENYSKEINFDLEGVSMWVHFFWSKTGEVAHIAYHLQPRSRFVKDDAMLAFLRSYARQHPIEVSAIRAFNHYGSASFPLYYYHQLEASQPIKKDK